MAFCIALAVRDMRMTIDEALAAATLGGARALRRDRRRPPRPRRARRRGRPRRARRTRTSSTGPACRSSPPRWSEGDEDLRRRRPPRRRAARALRRRGRTPRGRPLRRRPRRLLAADRRRRRLPATTSARPASATTSPAATRRSAPTSRADDVARRPRRGSWTRSSTRISFGVGRNERRAGRPPRARRDPRRGLRAPAPAARHGGASSSARSARATTTSTCSRTSDGCVWIGVHFGSRGFGHKTATRLPRARAGPAFDERAAEGEMDSPPVLFDVDSELGQSYIAAMELAGEYAYAGRDVVVDEGARDPRRARRPTRSTTTTTSPGARRTSATDVWVVRKGCTPAFPGQEGFVGATMGEPSVILRGRRRPSASRDAAATRPSTAPGA